MKKLKSGIVGLGFIGPVHIEALRRGGLADVVAIADVNVSLAQQVAERYQIPKVYDDYKKLLEDPEIDIVHICAPNYLHFDIAKKALECGKHVICEKPLVPSKEKAYELVRIAAEKKRVAVVSFNLRYYPMVQQARSMVQRGEIGKIYAYHGSYLQDWLLFETDYSWRLDPEISGPSRAFGDIGSHWIDMAEYVSGKRVVAVCADTAIFLPVRKKPRGTLLTFQKTEDIQYDEMPITTEDYVNVLFRFEDGMRGCLTVSQVSAGRKNALSFEIDGSEKALAWNSEDPNRLWIGNRDVPNSILIKDPGLMNDDVKRFSAYPGGHTEGFPDTSKQLFLEIYSYILRDGLAKGEVPTFPTFVDGAREVAICDAILESSKKSSWVEI